MNDVVVSMAREIQDSTAVTFELSTNAALSCVVEEFHCAAQAWGDVRVLEYSCRATLPMQQYIHEVMRCTR
jgi:hypothetical protein